MTGTLTVIIVMVTTMDTMTMAIWLSSYIPFKFAEHTIPMKNKTIMPP